MLRHFVPPRWLHPLPLRKLLKKTVEPFLKLDCGNYWNTICPIPAALLVSMLFIFPGNTPVERLSTLFGGMLTASMMLLMCSNIAGDYRHMHEKRVMTDQLESQKTYYAMLRANVEEARRSSHDFKHYTKVLTHYLDSNDMEGLRACCVELTEQISRSCAAANNSSSVLGGVLSHYEQMAEREGMGFVSSGTYEGDWISDMDLCVLLGNALDNAVEGCRTAGKDRRIAVTIRCSEDTVSILVQNTYDGQVNRQNDRILSRKGSERTGVGLQSIRSICNKYRGHSEICADEKLFSMNMILHKYE